jgi:hypothetical protein
VLNFATCKEGMLDTVDLRAGWADELARTLGVSLASAWRADPAPRTRAARTLAQHCACHRKVRLDDLLEYRRRQRHQAELAFADMVADTERLGLYDVDPADVAAALKAARRKSEG